MKRTFRNSLSRINSRLWRWQEAVDHVEYLEAEQRDAIKLGDPRIFTPSDKRELTLAKKKVRQLSRELSCEFSDFIPAFTSKFGK